MLTNHRLWAAWSPSRSKRRWNAPSWTTRCRSSRRAHCPTRVTASSPPAPDPYGMYDQGMRPDRQHRKSANAVGHVMPSITRTAISDLRRSRAHGAGLLPAVSAHRRARQLRSPARLPARRPALHRSAAAPLAMSCSARSTRTRSTSLRLRRPASEPIVVPARFPNLLVNGAAASQWDGNDIPPHNLREVIDATVHLIDIPRGPIEDLMAFRDGPTSRRVRRSSAGPDAECYARPGSIRMRAIGRDR